MSTELYRKYINIINENSQPDMLTEGMLDSIVHQQQSLEHQRLHPQQHQQSLQDLAANLGLCSHHSRRYEINKSY
jgi:hypothetical protein